MIFEPIAVATVGDDQLGTVLSETINHWQTDLTGVSEYGDNVAGEAGTAASS